jgi:hypothetical protein
MPIIGHTLAGIAIAQQFETVGSGTSPARGPLARALWMPLIVVISYLPDVVTQVAVAWIGHERAQAIGHSIPFGLPIGALIGVAWAAVVGGPARRLAVVAAGAIVLHDAMDLLQDPERMPFWPLSAREMGVDWFAEPNRIWGEVLAFGVPFVLFQVWRAMGARTRPAAARPRVHQRWVWAGRGLVLGVLIAALTVLSLREFREWQMDQAIALRRAGKFDEALALVELAERWPSSSGRGDITRGEAYAGLGDRARAEAAFLRAYERNPDDFWSVAVLATHYAGNGTREERRQRSAPLVEVLRREFPDEAALERVLEGIENNIMQAAEERSRPGAKSEVRSMEYEVEGTK